MPRTPLQTRASASAGTSMTLSLICLTLLLPIALSLGIEDAPKNAAALGGLIIDRDVGGRGSAEVLYEPQFVSFESTLIARQTENIKVLGNNSPERFSMEPASIAFFAFSVDGLTTRAAPFERGPESAGSAGQSPNPLFEDLFKRQTERTVFISANVCRHPERNTGDQPPALHLIVSYDPDDQFPNSTKATTQNVIFFEGSAMQSVAISSGTVYFSIEAPPVPDDFTGEWNLEVAVSDTAWYHSYAENSGEGDGMLWAADVDGGSALLMTKNLTENRVEAPALMTTSGLPFTLFVDTSQSRHLDGVRRSFCGLQNYAEIASTKNDKPTEQMLMSMTTRGLGNFPKQQFWFGGLNSSTNYTGILVRSKSTVLAKRQNTGGANTGVVQVFPEFQFQTTEGDNCRVITDLEFCNEVEYAVPANNNKFSNTTALAKAYDDFARTMYANFEKAMQQVPCEAPVTARYSLARNCDDCKAAYKNWLCTVAIPRCEDLSSTSVNARIRNVQQAFPNGTQLDESFINNLRESEGPGVLSSRNSWIDEVIAPGPYKEILPCDDLCYQIVQSCPASMGFKCPVPKDDRFKFSYARRGEGSCNFPISATFVSAGSETIVASGMVLIAALAASCFNYL